MMTAYTDHAAHSSAPKNARGSTNALASVMRSYQHLAQQEVAEAQWKVRFFLAVQSLAGEETGTMTAYTEQPP